MSNNTKKEVASQNVLNGIADVVEALNNFEKATTNRLKNTAGSIDTATKSVEASNVIEFKRPA